MGGQVLGGGVIALVAVVLWLVYLLPSWHSRHQYNASERNAVRLNQALRVLAETSETPQEVRLELNARTALAQQKLARRAQAEREELARRTQAEREELARRAQQEREQVELEAARRELAEARALPAARRGRARRRARLLVTIVGLATLALAGAGAWMLVATGSQLLLWGAGLGAVSCVLLLTRVSRVRAQVVVRAAEVAPVVERETGEVQDLQLAGDRVSGWAPRELPRPLTASAGSRAAAVLDAAAAREELRQAALEERMRVQAERRRPRSIETARVARQAVPLTDDAEIEAHVRDLLQRRAAG